MRIVEIGFLAVVGGLLCSVSQQDYYATLDRYGAAIRTLHHSRGSGQLTVEGSMRSRTAPAAR